MSFCKFSLLFVKMTQFCSIIIFNLIPHSFFSRKNVNLFEKFLKIRRDFQQLQHSDTRDEDEDSPSKQLTIASSKKVISVKIKKRAMERHSMRKIAASNKRNPSIRKIHIRIEKSIHITTNYCHIKNDDFVEGRKNDNEIAPLRVLKSHKNYTRIQLQLINFAMIFGVRLIKEILVI